MKKLQILLLFAMTLSACNTKKENVTIKGTVKDKKTTELLYSATFNENYNNWFKDSVIIDSTGHFTISLKIDQPYFISFKSNFGYKQIIIEPEKIYEIEIGSEPEPIKLVNKSDAQQFYDNLASSHPNAYGFFPEDISDYQNIYDSLRTNLEKELQDLSKIKCSEKVRNLIRTDRQVYYNLAFSSLASRINVTHLRNNEPTPDDIMKMWGNAVSDTFLTNITTRKADYYYDLLGLAFWYNLYTKLDYDSISVIRKEKREQGLIHSYNIELAESLLPKEILEFYSATYIQSRAKQKKFEKELINLSEKFKTKYSDSKYISYIQPSIGKIEDFYKKVAADSNEEYTFLDNYENINSLADCISPLKGKQIYIDIWSTSCGPCKEEFEYNEKLKETLKNKDVEIIYISLDSDQNKDRWKDMIKYYNLKGNHIRANEKLEADLKEKIERWYGIPRYLIIDEGGNIVNNDAPRPSNSQELEKQL
ncbi:TlpA disulfide reductase family protein [Carboxylicivirga linearis]|uniref:AhpC/TSA family protein n=1 Tax=Carboxylicivirga linearis TaxID=1628157 RepID=A0ABS5K325_9BACT|nr:TlpA disulfide reductase family protein [Carboxylicivirga linearis]MBS2101026.1 AhpC/TSA family protein [Carboxylicivirga linearis]